MKKIFYIIFFLFFGINQLSAQHAYLNMYISGKGKVAAEGALFNDKRLPKPYTFTKATKRVHGMKVVEFDGMDYIFERESRNEYKGIQGFPSVYDISDIDIRGTLELPDAIAIMGDSRGAVSGYFVGTKVEKIVFSPSIKYIGDAAFAHCKNLREVVFPEGCADVEISKDAFKGCINLTTIKVPKGQSEAYAQKMKLPISMFVE